MALTNLLHHMIDQDASDLHLKVGSQPGLRINGELLPIDGSNILSAEDMGELVEQLLEGTSLHEQYEEKREIDFSKHLQDVARFRVNLFHQRGSQAAVLRKIPIEIPELEGMGMSPVLQNLASKPRGLVLVTGPTGSGKSTTLAAMVDYINRRIHGHILTLEDPIEFIHQDKKCYVNQREIGTDSNSFSNALRAALREDPDIILVGELRDLETIALAITAAETGHLVLGTLHTTSAAQTVDRIIDVFPHEGQQQVKTQLSVALQGVISQTLLKRTGGGRIAAQEILVATDAVRNCIREGKTNQIINAMQTGAQHGMQTLEGNLAQLVIQRLITESDALAKCNNPSVLQQSIAQGNIPAPPTQATSSDTVLMKPAPIQAESKSEQNSEDDFEAFRRNRGR